MTVAYYPQRSVVPLDLANEAAHRRAIASTTNVLLAGHNNATMEVTLSGASTVLSDPRISIATAVVLVPLSAAAAAQLPSLYVTPAKGQATIWGGAVGLQYQCALIG